MTDQDLAIRLLNRNCYELDPGTPFLPTSPVAGMGHGHYVFRDRKGNECFRLFADSDCTAYTEYGCPGPSDVETLRRYLPGDELFPPRPGTAWETHHAFAAWEPNSHLLLDVIEDYCGPAATLEALVANGQFLQAEGLKRLFEEARRQKPAAAMALNWCFDEPWPAAANMSLVAWPDRPKRALDAVGAACRPTLASAKADRFSWREGETFAAELWLLHDGPDALPATVLEAEVELGGQVYPLVRWEAPAGPPNRNRQGPTARLVLPRADGDRLLLRLRCPDRSEWDSTYEFVYRTHVCEEVQSGARRLNA